MKKICIEGGGDWTDASYALLEIPDGVDVLAEAEKRNKWYKEVYVPSLKTDNKETYLSLDEWLIEKCSAQIDTSIDIYQDL